MANALSALQGALQKQQADKQRINAQKKGGKSKQQQKGLPPEVAQLEPSDLKKLLALMFVKKMHDRMQTKTKQKKQIYSKASLYNKLGYIRDNQEDVPSVSTKKVYSI